jgi:hypothetical protein
MYEEQFRSWFVQGLGEQRLVGFDAEERDKGEAGEEEKSAQDPSEARASYGSLVWRHSMETGPTEREMVSDGLRTGLAQRLLRIGLVQASLGQKIERSQESGERALKPLAENSVYISAETKSR